MTKHEEYKASIKAIRIHALNNDSDLTLMYINHGLASRAAYCASSAAHEARMLNPELR